MDTPHLVAKKMRAADVSFVDQIAASTPRLDGVVGHGEGLGPGSGGRDRASEPVGEVSIRALFSKGVAQARTDPAAAIGTHDELVTRYGDSTVPDVQESVAMSIVNKGVTQGQTDPSRTAKALPNAKRWDPIGPTWQVRLGDATAGRPSLLGRSARSCVRAGRH